MSNRRKKRGRTFRRGNKWWISLYIDGDEHRESAGDTEEEAEDLLDLRRSQADGEGYVPGRCLRVRDLLDSYDDSLRQRRKKSLPTVKSHGKPIRKLIGDKLLVSVTTDVIEWFQRRRLAAGKSSATVDRELEILRAAFRRALRHGIIKQEPFFPMFKLDNRRTGFFEADEFRKVVKSLPEAVAEIAMFAYLSGWRKGEIINLRWEKVDRGAREARLDDSKNRKPRTLALEGSLWKIVERRWRRREFKIGATAALSPFVFHRDGRPLTEFRKSWASACKAAGVENRLFHDLRRSAIRNMIRGGVLDTVAMEISGHKTRSVFDRYNIASLEDQRAALRQTEAYLASLPRTATGPTPKSGQKTRTDRKRG